MSTSNNIYVAVIDEDTIFCRSLGRLLRAAGMQAITYPSTEHFLSDEKHPRFDCLVLDVKLGGSSGIDLQKQLRTAKEPTPAIFFTAQHLPGIREKALASGCVAFLQKADSLAELLETIRRLAS